MADAVLTNRSLEERGLARVAQRMAAWTEKWFPDAYVFALAGVVLVAVAALANGSSPQPIADAFGDGFWDLTAFTLQMAMVVLTGYVVATSPPVARLDRPARPRCPRRPRARREFRGAAVDVRSRSSTGASAWSSAACWPGRSPAGTDLRVDYRALGAAAFMGLGAVWALGMSSSAAQLQATAASLPPGAAEDHRRARLRHHDLHLAVAADMAHPDRADRGDRALLRAAGRRHPDRRGHGRGPRRRPPRRRRRDPARASGSEYSPILPILAGLLTLGWLVSQFVDQAVPDRGQQPQRLPAGLPHPRPGAARHPARASCRPSPRPSRPRPASSSSSRCTPPWPPILTKATGRGGVTVSEHLADFFTNIGGGGAFAVVIALYTAAAGPVRPLGRRQVARRGAVRHAVGHRRRR